MFLEFFGWAYGAGGEVSAAVGADVFVVDEGAILAEGAFERADVGFGGVRGEVFVTAFAVGAEF